MRKASLLGLLALPFFSAPAQAASADAGNRVGVIAIGPDAAAAGELQRDLELRLAANPKIALRGANDLAPILAHPAAGTSPAPGPDAGVRKQADDLLKAASDAYYDDRAAAALDRLAALQLLEEQNGAFPVTDRVRLLLWRTAVFLALKDTVQAETEARAALSLNPELAVDLNEFRPSVKDEVDRVRARGLHLVTVVVTGLPPGGTLRIDDRPAGARIPVPAGKHRLTASAPGRRDVTRTFDAAGDVSVPMVLPIAIDPNLETALGALAWRGTIGPGDEQMLSVVGSRLGVDWLVIGATRLAPAAESRVTLVSTHPGGSAFASPQIANGAGANGALASWIDARVSAETGGAAGIAAAPTPVPARTPAPGSPHRPRPGLTASSPVALEAEGGLAWTDRVRTLSGSDPSGSGTKKYPAGFGGVGPRVGVVAAKGALFGSLDLSLVSYSISTLDVTLPASQGGGKETVHGGSSTNAHLAAGWQHAFGDGDREGAPSLRLGGGLLYESHAAEDVKDGATGEKLALLTSYTREALELSASGRIPFRAPGGPAIVAGVAVSPFGAYAESPSKANGNSPALGPGLDWRLGATIHATRTLEIEAAYEGAMRSVKFKGASAATGATNVTIQETWQGFAALAHLRF